MYLKGGKGIEKPVDFDGTEIKEGDTLTYDGFDPYFDENYYKKNHPSWSREMIYQWKHKPVYRVKYNPKGFFFAEGIEKNLYLHDFRFKYTKIVNPTE